MTPVSFHFLTPAGVPIANSPFEVQLSKAAFNTEINGVIMPRLLTGMTDADGRCTLQLWPLTTLYHAVMYDPVSEAGLHYKFYVPELEVGTLVLELQDLIVDIDPTVGLGYSEETLMLILSAKANTLAYKNAAEAAALLAQRAIPVTAATPPVNPTDGMTWISSLTGKHYSWLIVAGHGQWVELFAAEVVDNHGGTGTGGPSDTLTQEALDLAAAAGSAAGTASGIVAGTQAGTQAGATAGATAGNTAGTSAGTAAGTTAGTAAGALAGAAAGQTAGALAGAIAGAAAAGSGGGGTGGGTGKGNRGEVELLPDGNGVITPDGSLSNRFRFTMTKDLKLGNPINFANNEHIYLTGFQDTTGQHVLTYGLLYMLPAAQPFIPPKSGNAMFLIELRPTQNPQAVLNWALWGYPDSKTADNGFSLVTAVASIGVVKYFAMRDAFAAAIDGDTVVVERNGTSYEATGALTGTNLAQVFTVAGRPVVINGVDQRPLLKMPTTDYGEGPPRGMNRPAFGKAILNFEGKGKVYVRDLRITGARNFTNNAHGLCNNADSMTMIINNVEITDCNNGVLNGNTGMVGNTEFYDVLIDKCGVGGPDPENSHGTMSSAGFTHSIYMGHNNATVKLTRVTLSNSLQGDNLKCRSGTLIATQLRCTGAQEGRELEIPNGGTVLIDNSEFIKPATSNNGSLVILGGNGGAADTPEGLDTTRPRRYLFTNVLFHSDYTAGTNTGRDGYLVCNLDPLVPVEFVDCKFEGPLATSNANDPNNQPLYAGTVTVNGIRYKPSAPPVFTLTGGPIGPIKPVGYFPVAMTPLP